jgi:CheY-like chemotaxis protein
VKRIAIVEDNPDNQMLMEALLEDDYALQMYSDGAEAVDGILGSVPDLVLMDISLPVMDGVEVMKRLRAEGHTGLPIIALTAHAMAGDEERFRAQGFDGYLSKPIIDESLLFAAIERLTG